MSGLRGPSGAGAGAGAGAGHQQQRSMDYPLTGAQQLQFNQQPSAQPNSSALTSPIHIQPRASPRTQTTASVNAGMNMAQSCPTFSWQPPPAPSARPRLASVDPPPMELPPSPPVFSPMQQEQVKGRKEESTSVALKKQIYSRSLSNYSSSAPTHVDYLSKFHPNLGQLDETTGMDDDSDEEEEPAQQQGGYKPSARASQQMRRPADIDDDDSPLDEPTHAGIGIGQGIAMKTSQAHGRVQQMQRGDDFGLGKSPTIFSIMSTSQHNQPHPSLHTADTSASSSGSQSPGHSILGTIAAGEQSGAQQPRRPLQSNKPPAQTRQPQPSDEDDLQFSISLTDEQEADGEDNSNGKQQDFMPLY